MKNLKVTTGILAMAFLTFVALSCKGETKNNNDSALQTTEVKQLANLDISFGVRGNCGMCKKTIEKAVNAVDGVTKAVWDVDKKKIDVSFDDSKTDEMAIHHAIAASGYDTEKVSGDLNAYKNLPGCCQYDHEMAINQNQ
ncbi:MAG TPA: heavy-metal-associated domain-containing protein [Yeosuana sp.]